MTVFRVVAASATMGASAGSSACSRMGPSSPHAALRANRPPSSGRYSSPDTIPRATSPATISSPAPACSPVVSGIRSLQNRGYSLHAPSPRALHLPAHGARWHPGRQGAAGSRRDPKLGGGKLEMDLNERQEPSKIVVPSTHKPRVLIHIAKEE